MYMTKDIGILILGLIVAAMPFSGFPFGIEKVIFIVSGLAIAILAFLIRGDLSSSHFPRKSDTFSENGAHPKEHETGQGMTRGDDMRHGDTKQENQP